MYVLFFRSDLDDLIHGQSSGGELDASAMLHQAKVRRYRQRNKKQDDRVNAEDVGTPSFHDETPVNFVGGSSDDRFGDPATRVDEETGEQRSHENAGQPHPPWRESETTPTSSIGGSPSTCGETPSDLGSPLSSGENPFVDAPTPHVPGGIPSTASPCRHYQVNAKVVVYASLSGMVSFLSDGTIHGCNHHFALMLFGYTQHELLKKVRQDRNAQ